jgi:predicted negative regulator of RcsB-dependent stress response
VEFETEEQQVEAIKKWFKEYGTTIIAGLVLGLVGIFGFRYFDKQQELTLAKASDGYETVMVLLTEQNDNEKFITAASAFNTENPDSIYSNLLSLQLAKLAVAQDDLGTAAQHLKDAMNNAQHGTVEHIARIRLVRTLIAQNEGDKALAIIAEVVGDEFGSSYEMLRGDIWLAKGDRSRASQAYAAAKKHSEDGPVAPSLEMLLTDLADETAVADVK